MNTETNPAGTMARLQAAEAELQRLREQEPVRFHCHSPTFAPAYVCSKPGDMSGDYYREPVPPPLALDVVISGDELAALHEWSEESEFERSSIRLFVADGGLHMACAEYPDEGTVHLADVDCQPVPPPDVRELVEALDWIVSGATAADCYDGSDEVEKIKSKARATLAKYRGQP